MKHDQRNDRIQQSQVVRGKPVGYLQNRIIFKTEGFKKPNQKTLIQI